MQTLPDLPYFAGTLPKINLLKINMLYTVPAKRQKLFI
jgi:hypothetical protein